MIFSLEKNRVKPGTVLIETMLSWDYLYPYLGRHRFEILKN